MSNVEYRLTTLSDGQQLITAHAELAQGIALADGTSIVSSEPLPQASRKQIESIAQKLHTHSAKLDTISKKLTFAKKGKTSSTTE